jgi:DNA/RNA-binding domain of Phe-tRNA-synthetase-like protein
MLSIQATKIVKEKINGLKLGILSAHSVTVQKMVPEFEDDLAQLVSSLRDKFKNRRPAEDEVVGYVRRMYRRIGWEPTRYRPSSEALVRRLLKGNGLYRINNLVDYGNLVSARFHLPMGLYDTDKIKGRILIDVGSENESYRGISNPEIHATGKLILRDDLGIFGNPTADSFRTSISEDTTSFLAVFFCPPEVETSYLNKTMRALQSAYQPFTEGEIEQQLTRI